MQSNPELPGRDKLSKTMKYVTLLDLYFKVDKLKPIMVYIDSFLNNHLDKL